MISNLSAWLKRRRPGLPRGIEFEDSSARFSSSMLEGAGADETIICPSCDTRQPLHAACANCGFPFICGVEPIPGRLGASLRPSWRTLLAIFAIGLWLASVVVIEGGNDAYMGRTIAAVAQLVPDTTSGIPIGGPASFVKRTQLALGLLHQRDSEVYYRLQQSVKSISFLDAGYLAGPQGRKVTLEGIGALSEPQTGRVQVLFATAFPDGVDELDDYDVFSYAGVLVHELRHIELHAEGQAPGGWQEEVLCEQSAYAAERALAAPGAILTRYELYLANPTAKQYQGWYRWYRQWQ